MVKNLTADTNCNWEWIDLVNPDKTDFEEISQKYNLHPAVVYDSLQPDHLPKYEQIEDVAFAIVRVFDKEIGQDGDTVQDLTNKIAVFYSREFLITVHRDEYPFLEEIKKTLIETNHCKSPYHLFIQLVKEVLQSFEQPALKLATDLDYYESKVFLRNNPNKSLTTGIYWLKRKAEVSRRVLNLSKIVLDNLNREQKHDPYIQDVYDMYLRLLTMYEEVDNGANNLLNIYIGLASHRTNEIVRVLTIFSVFFMPLTFIVGIYGMNFKYMPELQMRGGYPVTMLAMLLITIGIYIWFRKKEWL
ncbi:magnesium transport protein CorA [Adhaeribacter aerolatus]|uniref:Magnesium transport protein CorA n=1 Tax=Adhaeribacter aerolatus TaxID=670289 RepID=A0A512AWC8_9BACT|nr:CorA family divalent cation transporter [Adhaeribacter aerolatus]GEO03980.1 magnesium transport protein CorA [Adhaeribacter aerolatus]